MKTKICIAFFLSVFLAASSYAQKPGYMGRRYMAGAEFSYGYGSLDIFPFNVQYGVFMDYVATRNVQIGINYFIYNNRCSRGVRMDNERMKGYNAMFKVRFYRAKGKGAIAPIGKYLDFGISVTGNKIIFDPERIALYETQNVFIPEIKGTFIQPSIAGGIQTVLFGCLAADASIRAGFVPVPVSISDSRYRAPFLLEVYFKNMVNFNTRIAYMF